MTHSNFTGLAACCLLVTCSVARSESALSYRFVNTGKVERTYFVPRVPKGKVVAIDGKLDDALWKTSPKLTEFVDEVGKQGKTALQLGYDGEYLYLGVRCEVDDGAKLVSRSPAGTRDEKVWGGHCIDFKVGIPGKSFQFLVAPSGALMDMEEADRKWNAPSEVKTSIEAKAYVVEMKIKYGAFHLPANADGNSLKIAFGRATPDEQIQTLSRPYGSLESAPVFILGSAKDKARVQSGRFMSRKTALIWNTDREEYTSAIPAATGRIRIIDLGGERLEGEAAIQFAVTDGKRDFLAERIYPIEGRDLNYDVNLTSLKPGAYTAELRLMQGDEVFDRMKRRLVIKQNTAPRSGKIVLTVPACPAALGAWPVTFGAPFPEGALTSAENLSLTDAAGNAIPMQARVTSRWSRGGPIRWTLIDAIVPVKSTEQKLTLSYGPGVKRAVAAKVVSVTEAKMPDGRAALRIESKRLKGWLPKTKSPGIIEVEADGSLRFRDAPEVGPYLIDEAGTVYYGNLDPEPEVTIVVAGPVKACVRVKGWHVSKAGGRLGKFILTYRIFAGVPHVFMDHTFVVTGDSDEVRYRDIGYNVSGWSAQGIFGAPRLLPFNLTGVNDSAYLLQRDDLYGKVVMNGKFFEEFGRAEGWVSAGITAVSVRDFWQNFPKEFEVAPNRLTIHFWPGHGEAPLRTGERLNERNAYQCWFAHEGELLDFKATDEVVELVKKEGSNHESLIQANAMGIAKTHHLMFQFHDGNWDRARVRSTHQVFDMHPTAIVDPEWMCGSGAFGKIAPRRMERLPETEKAIDGLVARFIRQQDEDRDYGMWNFGDAHHNWIWHKRRWRLYRTWRATHHSWPRWPWMQFARSGSFEALQYARRNAYHVADISHCHYTDDEFRTVRYPIGKIVGGICDYKGLVHWNAGNRFGYNSVADVLLQHYYLTGDLRALDTALAHGSALIEEDRSNGGREGSARLMSLVALYQHTWDNRYLKLIDMHVETLLRTTVEKTVMADEWTASRASHSIWTPGFISYLELSGAEAGRKFISRWADYLVRVGMDGMFGHEEAVDSAVCAILAHLAYGWRTTGDPKYLGAAAHRNRGYTGSIYTGDDPRFHGAPALARRNMPLSFWLTDVGYYLGAMDDYGKELPAWAPQPRPSICSLWEGQVEGKRRNMFHARIRQSREGPFKIRVFVSKRDHVAELKRLNGGPILRAAAKSGTTRFKSMEAIEINVPADDCLEYAFRTYTDKGYAFMPLPVATGQEGLKEVYPLRISGRNVTVCGGTPFYFDLPEGTTSCQFFYQGEHGHRITFRNPQGKVVFDETGISESGRMTADLKLNGSTRGWSVHYAGARGGGKCMLRVEQISPVRKDMWLSVSRDNFFWPTKKADVWK